LAFLNRLILLHTNATYPANIFHRLHFQLTLKGFKVVSRKRFVSEVKRFLANSLFAVGGREDAADAFDGRRAAVSGQDAAADDALDFVVANAGHVLVLDVGRARVVAEDAERIAEQSSLSPVNFIEIVFVALLDQFNYQLSRKSKLNFNFLRIIFS
jgi:hypothetical protein